MTWSELAIAAAERGWLPDVAIRAGIRAICAQRLRSLGDDPEQTAETIEVFRQSMAGQPVAVSPDLANRQHYEVPAAFFELMLGPARKYSCAYWADPSSDLAGAEEEALSRTCRHAQLEDGQRILELGCGWGSLSLYVASRYPKSRLTAVSNSSSQKSFIETEARRRGLSNISVITADINDFQASGLFDRVISVEMFEHVRNHPRLLARIRRWMAPEARLLVHLFCGCGPPYSYEVEGPQDWMARHFFSGGVMPSDDLMLRCQDDLVVERHWRWSGRHYQRTLEAWLERLDRHAQQAVRCLAEAGEPDPRRAFQRWRMFVMACSELFGYEGGRRWWVSHYRFAAARPDNSLDSF
jgi:cyclopropane-fatty-acyl-phospholipid synthase